jgi:hypothetical protein
MVEIFFISNLSEVITDIALIINHITAISSFHKVSQVLSVQCNFVCS